MRAWWGAAALPLLIAAPAEAAGTYDAVTGIVTWFQGLNSRWKGVVAEQERAQLLRSVDRLRRSLYALETDSRLLLGSLPERAPRPDQVAALAENVAMLRQSVATLDATVRATGADLRLYGGVVAERHAARVGAVRGMALDEVDRQLDDPARWNVGEMRRYLSAGIDATQRAQLAVTTFRQRLAAERE